MVERPCVHSTLYTTNSCRMAGSVLTNSDMVRYLQLRRCVLTGGEYRQDRCFCRPPPAALGLGDVSHSYHIRKVFSPDRHQLEPKLVQKLFAHGTDPFQLSGGGNNTTVFDAFLSKIKVMAHSQCSDSLLIKWSHTLQALLQYPSQPIFHQTPSRCSDWKHDITRISSSLTSLIDNVYAKRLPKEASALRRLLSSTGKRRRESDKCQTHTKRLRPNDASSSKNYLEE